MGSWYALIKSFNVLQSLCCFILSWPWLSLSCHPTVFLTLEGLLSPKVRVSFPKLSWLPCPTLLQSPSLRLPLHPHPQAAFLLQPDLSFCPASIAPQSSCRDDVSGGAGNPNTPGLRLKEEAEEEATAGSFCRKRCGSRRGVGGSERRHGALCPSGWEDLESHLQIPICL